MADIRHRVGIDAPRERVYQALATRDGTGRVVDPGRQGRGGSGREA